MKKRLIILFGLLFFTSAPATFAQIGDIGKLLRAGADDAETITQSYLTPIPSGTGANINSGWITSAKPHKTLGFDLQVRGALSFVPKSDQTFNLNNLRLQKVRAADPSDTMSPTVGGDDNLGPEVIVEDDSEEITRFNLPKGSGYSFVPAPMVQASVGIIKNTDVIARYVPEVMLDDSKFNMAGFGLKHSLNQWLPSGKLLPVTISVLAGYTNINLNSTFDVQPEEGAIPNPENPETATTKFDNQEGEVSLNTFTIKALVGKDLPFFSFYGGVGYESSKMNVDISGNYPVSARIGGVKAYDVVKNPFEYNADGKNKLSLLGGLTLKMAFFHIFGEFTLAKYSTANAGVGFSFR